MDLENLGMEGVASDTFEEWYEKISACSIFCKDIEKMNNPIFFRKKNVEYNNDLRSLKTLKNSKYRKLSEKFIPLKFVEFFVNDFDLESFLIGNKKMLIMSREVMVMNILMSLVQGLSLCEAIGVPHGNICIHTIFKKSKFAWEISPPMYSQVCLEKRYMECYNKPSKRPADEYAIEFCIAPEIYNHYDGLLKCKNIILSRK